LACEFSVKSFTQVFQFRLFPNVLFITVIAFNSISSGNEKRVSLLINVIPLNIKLGAITVIKEDSKDGSSLKEFEYIVRTTMEILLLFCTARVALCLTRNDPAVVLIIFTSFSLLRFLKLC